VQFFKFICKAADGITPSQRRAARVSVLTYRTYSAIGQILQVVLGATRGRSER